MYHLWTRHGPSPFCFSNEGNHRNTRLPSVEEVKELVTASLRAVGLNHEVMVEASPGEADIDYAIIWVGNDCAVHPEISSGLPAWAVEVNTAGSGTAFDPAKSATSRHGSFQLPADAARAVVNLITDRRLRDVFARWHNGDLSPKENR